MSTFLSQLQNIAITAASAAVVTLIGIAWKFVKGLISAKIDQVRSETDNQKLKYAMDLLEKICDDVSASFDPVAEKMKSLNEDGRLSKEDIEQLQLDSQDAALNAFKSIFSESTLREIGLDDYVVNDLIARAIEASLQRRKALKSSC